MTTPVEGFPQNQHESLPLQQAMPKGEWHEKVDQGIQEVHEAGENEVFRPLSVILVDIDNQKSINDELGHLSGDQLIDIAMRAQGMINEILGNSKGSSEEEPEVLVGVSENTEVDPVDFELEGQKVRIAPSRLGGDEFGILCEGVDEAMVAKIVSMIRDDFTKLLPEDFRKRGANLSIGHATLQPGMDKSDLLTEADKRLYEDKKSHLKELTEQELKLLEEITAHLIALKIRPRELPKYLAKYALDEGMISAS